MNVAIIAPDTGLLLAVGYGKDIDPKAATALAALEVARKSGVRVILLDSVREELDGKLNEIAEVIPALQSAIRDVPNLDAPADLDAIEGIMVRAKAASPERVARYLDAIEAESVRACNANPNTPIREIIGGITGAAVTLLEVVRARIDGLRLELWKPKPDSAAVDGPLISGVTGYDFDHVRSSEALGRAEDTQVCFIVFEAKLHSRQQEVTRGYPHVVVTNPNYLPRYLTGGNTEDAR